MAYQRHPSDVYTRQNRASTAPGPLQPSFSPRDAAIPPSLIPGYRHRETISVANGVDSLLFSQADPRTRSETAKVSVAVTPVGGFPEYYYVRSPSPYHDIRTPPPPLLPHQHQTALPPLPPKTPIITPSMSPALPPKPPPFMPSLPLYHSNPPIPRSKSQPPPPLPRGASIPFNLPPTLPPPLLPPKPRGARSTSVIVTPSYLRSPPVMPPEKMSPDTDDKLSLILPSLSSSSNSPHEPPVVNEEEELEIALTVSAHSEKEHAESLLSQDEELARALEESLLDSARRPQPRQQPSRSRAATMESDHLPSSSSSSRPLESHPYSPKKSPHLPLPARVRSSTSSASLASVQLKEDEAYARKLDAEYQSIHSTPTALPNHNVELKDMDGQLPRYSDIVSDTGTCAHGVMFGRIDNGLPQATPYLKSEAAGRVPHVSSIPTSDERYSVPHHTTMAVPPQMFGRINNGLPQATPHLESEAAGRVPHISSTPAPDERYTVPQQTTTTVPPQQSSSSSSSRRTSPRPASLVLSLSPEEEEPPESLPASSQASRTFVTPNQFIEPELLYGVCK